MNLILLSAILDGDRYGYEITKEVFRLTDGEIQLKEGSLYPALHKLEKLGYVKSYWQQSENGVPGRKYYSITESGKLVVEEEKKKWSKFIGVMGKIIYGEQNT
jgi:PadR family transcriptional regulator PadR